MTSTPEDQPGPEDTFASAEPAEDLAGGESQETAAPRPGGEADEIAEAFAADATVAQGVGAEATDAEVASGDELVLAQTALAERTLDLQRLQAEFLNYKRRVERDRELVKQNAVFSVLAGLLPVLDDIDRAREHGELEGGFKAVADSLERAVAGLGLVKYGAAGDAFDPNVHEALMHGHSPDVTTTTVEVVAQPGYRIGERVLRAAKVTVLDPEA